MGHAFCVPSVASLCVQGGQRYLPVKYAACAGIAPRRIQDWYASFYAIKLYM